MSEEEKAGLVTGKDAAAGAAGDPVDGAAAGAGEGEEAAGADAAGAEEEKDERGVPAKNRISELERKNRQLETKLAEERRRNIQLQPKDKGEGEKPGFKELTIEEIAERADTTPETVKVLAEFFENRIDRRLYMAEKEQRENLKWRQEKETKLMSAIEEFDREFGDDESGRIFVEDANGRKTWNDKSELLKKAREILAKKPRYKEYDNGALIALMEAKTELMKAKPANREITTLDKTQSMLGQGGRTGRTVPAGGAGWKPTKVLSDAEYDKLTPAQQDEYDKWEIAERLKKSGLVK